MAGSRLDRAYLPGPLRDRLETVEHVASLSDHAVLVVRLKGGLGAPSPLPPPSRASYWKLNVSLLSELDFLPGFQNMWVALLAARPPGAPPAGWWEEKAKLACLRYCVAFSKQEAHHRRETTFIVQAGLQQALDEEDWPSVAVGGRPTVPLGEGGPLPPEGPSGQVPPADPGLGGGHNLPCGPGVCGTSWAASAGPHGAGRPTGDPG